MYHISISTAAAAAYLSSLDAQHVRDKNFRCPNHEKSYGDWTESRCLCVFFVYISHFLSIISLFCMRLSYIIKTYLIWFVPNEQWNFSAYSWSFSQPTSTLSAPNINMQQPGEIERRERNRLANLHAVQKIQLLVIFLTFSTEAIQWRTQYGLNLTSLLNCELHDRLRNKCYTVTQ